MKKLRWTLINLLFTGAQIEGLQNVIDAGATIDQISEVLLRFGPITKSKREDALNFAYTMLLKGKLGYFLE